jgi:RNA polymerase sigma-70 factor (ECF subfamily)
MSDDASDDLELLRRWQAGDRRAGDRLFRRHFSLVFGFFGARLRADASDLVQRTFLACVESQHKLAPTTDFSRYLVGICKNVLLMHLRRRHIDDRTSLRGSVDAGRSTQRRAAFDRICAREDGRRLAMALDQLGTDDQLALRLYYWEDWSVAAIAELFRISRAAVKFRLFRGRRRLAAALDRVDDRGAVSRAVTRPSAARAGAD